MRSFTYADSLVEQAPESTPVTAQEVGFAGATAPVVPTGYEELALVLRWALDHAAAGKGAQRHSTGEPFTQQPILTITRRYGLGFALGQAEKKMQESTRMKPMPAKHELLGAINYIAAAVIRLEEIEREIHPPL